MTKGDHGQTNQLHDINWGARDMCVHVCVCVLLSRIIIIIEVLIRLCMLLCSVDGTQH